MDLLKESVDPGEASAIALAMEISYPLLIVDDLKGRKLAIRMDISIMGTLGMLLKAKQQYIIPFIKPYINRIQSTNFRVSQAIVNYLLEQAGE